MSKRLVGGIKGCKYKTSLTFSAYKAFKHHSEGRNVRRTLHTKRKRRWYKNYSEKRHLQIIKRKKNKEILVAKGAPVNEGPWLQRNHEDENEAKQNKDNARERRHGTCIPNARRIQVRATCG